MRFEIERARALYTSADRGIALLPPRSAACVRSARVLYCRILDEIEGNDYDVFSNGPGCRPGREPVPPPPGAFGGTIEHEKAVGPASRRSR